MTESFHDHNHVYRPLHLSSLESFIYNHNRVFSTGANVIKLLRAQITPFHNKLERFSLREPFQPSIMFADNAIANPSTFQVLRSRLSSWPYPQTLDKTGKACQGQTL